MDWITVFISTAHCETCQNQRGTLSSWGIYPTGFIPVGFNEASAILFCTASSHVYRNLVLMLDDCDILLCQSMIPNVV